MNRDRETEKAILQEVEKVSSLTDIAGVMYSVCVDAHGIDCNYECEDGCSYFVNHNLLAFLTILLEYNTITKAEALKFQLDYSKDDSVKNIYT